MTCAFFGSKVIGYLLYNDIINYVRVLFDSISISVFDLHSRIKRFTSHKLKSCFFLCVFCGKRGGHIVNLHLLVIQSVDQLSAFLDSNQTWYIDCLKRVDDPYWFSGHVVEGQVLDFVPKVVPSIFYDPFNW